MNGGFQRPIEQIGKVGINNEAENPYLSVRDQGRQHVGNFGGRLWEESHRPCRKEFVEFFVLSQKIAEYRDEKETERDKRHEKKIGHRTGKNRTVVFEKGENALQDHVHVK